MGAGQSTTSKTPSRALHVLRVTPSSPASETSIEPYFDFVVGFKDETLSSNDIDAAELERIVESHEGRPLDLLIWNSKNQNIRVVPIVPSREWSLSHTAPGPKEPESDRKPSLLGLSMRMCEPEFAVDNVWHVLDVLEGSPAESAGLVPYGDWIIGWSGGVLSAEGDFYEVVEAHVEKPLRVYVYSFDFDNIREVVLVPNRHWGGEGLLGCVFGFGLLHRIPPIPENREPGAIPLELTRPSDEYEEQQLFVPADLEGAESPEKTEERMRWEQEELERESYARNYMQASNQSPSAYSHESSPEANSQRNNITKVVDIPNLGGRSHNAPLIRSASAVRVAGSSSPEQDHIPRVRSPLSSIHRPSTPTPASPLGYHVNGLGLRPRTPSWDARAVMFDAAHQHSSPTTDSDDDEDDHDGTISLADTDTTDISGASERTSQGSLTSVDYLLTSDCGVDAKWHFRNSSHDT